MHKVFFSWLAVLLVNAAVSVASAEDAPLTLELLDEIRRSRYADESVQTTNGNIIGIFTTVVRDNANRPALGVMQAYDNVTRTKQFVAVPWSLFRFDAGSRRIQIQAAAEQLRNAPRFSQEQIASLKEPAQQQKVYQHFGAAAGGGAVAATMGSSTGQGASLPPTATNDAQPKRGSVAVMYVLGVLAVGAIILGYFGRRRA